MVTYWRLEVLRMLRDRRFLILMLVLPVGMYLLFTNVFGQEDRAAARPDDVLGVDVRLMVSMAAFGAIGAALSATGPRIAQERAIGWMRQLRVMPMPARQVIIAKVLAAMTMALPAIVLVATTAVLAHGVRLAAWQWLAIGGMLWLGTAPFAALGVWIGYLADGDSAFAVMYGVYLALSALGGLWMPVHVLPSVLQDIAPMLPSNRFAELGWNVAAGTGPSMLGVAVLAGWLVVFAALALLGYRRRIAA
ncbi:ABC transporter permease [Solihabitans fulvus]|uniref:ABC transporter permease n=1 Tax=Solihabitans fulvus TaxID=1892852 RepID=A0A5B2XH28_9PSEU|nr:ABC transporter permease [Solihabitans fulvus]KAA2262703.1 ABC transporter permease [Solihabitans fulvus]